MQVQHEMEVIPGLQGSSLKVSPEEGVVVWLRVLQDLDPDGPLRLEQARLQLFEAACSNQGSSCVHVPWSETRPLVSFFGRHQLDQNF